MEKNAVLMKIVVVAIVIFALTSVALSVGAAAEYSGGTEPPTTQGKEEPDLVVLVGDIDNLGFGWPEGFDIFSGKSTSAHRFPWNPEPDDPPGTDRIMVGTSYDGHPPAGKDGYTRDTRRPDNLPQPISMQYNLAGIQVKSAVLQMFVDDFQSPAFKSKFQVKLSGQRAPFLEDVLNSLNQGGPIGKLITVQVPADFLSIIASGNLEISIDDPTTGAGDGFAIDFVRLLVNPHAFAHTGRISGHVVDAETGESIQGATVSASGVVSSKTDSSGAYTLENVPAGLATVTASATGYISQILSKDLSADASVTIDFRLTKGVPPTPTPTPIASTLTWKGMDKDKVSRGNGPNPDGVPDGHFSLTLTPKDAKTVNRITLLSTDKSGNPVGGQVWNTVPDGNWILGVEQPSGNRLNPTDKSISKTITTTTTFELYGANSGWFKEGQHFKAVVGFTDGTSSEAITTVSKTPTPTPLPTPTPDKCEGDEPYLYVEDRVMGKGKTVEIPIMMCNAKELANMDLDWSFDASVLKLINVTKGSLNEKAVFDWNEVSPGKLKIAFASSEGVTGSDSIAVMKFEVIGNTGDTSTLTGTVTTASKTDGTEISVSVNPGEFTVGTSPVKGDCDGDGELTERDALVAIQMSVVKLAVDMCCDYNGDGKVDSSDAREILKAIGADQ